MSLRTCIRCCTTFNTILRYVVPLKTHRKLTCATAHAIKYNGCSYFHTSMQHNDLMEFFDEKKNWKAENVYVGRPWKLDELRIKSNEDLHKLWYILLKERNMLFTMEKEYCDEVTSMPNPERIEKVEESMSNILKVIEERDVAYNLLEKGDSGLPKVRLVCNTLGLIYPRTEQEHAVPKHENKEYQLLHCEKREPWMREMHKKYFENLRRKHEAERKRIRYIKKNLKKKFPHLTKQELTLGVKQHFERNDFNDTKF